MKVLRYVLVVAACVLLSRCAWSDPTPKQSALPAKGEAARSYQIANKRYGDLLRPKDADGSEGTPLVLYSAQPWKCMTWKLTPRGDGAFTVQNHFTGKTFATAAEDKGTAIVQVALPKEDAKAVKWRFVRLDDGSYRIAEAKSGAVLTATKGEHDSEARIALMPWAGKDEQKWVLEEIDPAKLTM